MNGAGPSPTIVARTASACASAPHAIPPKRAELGIDLGLEAAIARLALAIGEDGQIVLDLAGRGLVDEVAEARDVSGQRRADRAGGAAQARFDAEAAFGVEVGVADLERLRAGVGAVGEQFVDRRGAGSSATG